MPRSRYPGRRAARTIAAKLHLQMVGSPIARHDHWQRLLDVVASIPHLIEQGSTDYVPLGNYPGLIGPIVCM